MISLRKITDAADKDFKELLSLYKESFPIEERRNEEQLESMLKDEKRMIFNAIESDGQLLGLLVYWDFKSFYYLEHLAIFPDLRNQKIGQQTLAWIDDNLKGLRILEAEPADTDIAIRRVRYYERNGYKVCDKNYMQPSYRPDGDGCALWVMCNYEDPDLADKLKLLKDVVYYRFC